MENNILQVWHQVYPSLADCILLTLCTGIFFWFRSSIKNAIIRFTETMNQNAISVKEHLDEYNVTHEKSWAILAKLVEELKIGKIGDGEYRGKIEHLEAMGCVRDKLIDKLDNRLTAMERQRRNGDPK